MHQKLFQMNEKVMIENNPPLKMGHPVYFVLTQCFVTVFYARCKLCNIILKVFLYRPLLQNFIIDIKYGKLKAL